MATAEEIRRAREETSVFAPLFEYARSRRSQLSSEGRRPVLGGLLSKEPVMGTDTLRYEGVGSLLAALLDPIARGVDAPRAASQNLIPQEDMIGEAFGTAGTAMLGGGVAAKPAGSLGANTLRVYHGGDYKKSDAIKAPFFVTPNKEGAQWFADENDGTVTQYSADIKNPFIIGSKQDNDNLFDLLKRNDIDPEELEDLISDNSPYDGSNILDAAYVPEVRAALQREGYDALYNPSDVLENTNIPAYAVIDPKVLSANASKSAGLLSVASDVSARGDQILNMLKSGRGSEVTDAMLDMGDGTKNTQLNQYLAANYDLPMDEASRLARAQELGYEGNLFHGTDADILALDKEKFGLGENLLGKGFYTTGNPKRANIYVPIGNPKLPKGVFQTGNSDFTEGGNILPLMTRSSSEFDARQSTGKANALNIGKAFEGSDFDVEIKDEGDQVFIKSKINPDLSVYIDSYQDGMITLQKLKDVFGRENVTNILEEAGFTGLKAPESSGSVTRVNYNPQDVRTQFARFDPRLSHLSNVTAANASPMSGLLAQSGVSSEQAQEIEDYLSRTGLLQ